MEIGTGCYKIKRVSYNEKIKINAEQLVQNKRIEQAFTKILKTLKGLDYRIEEDGKFTYFYYNVDKQPTNKKFNISTNDAITNFEQFLLKGFNLTLNDVSPMETPGEWQIKQNKTFFKKFIPFIQSVPKIIVFHDNPRDINGKFQSKYTAWRHLKGD